MYNIQKEFDKIWSKAREANKVAGMERFRKIEEAKGPGQSQLKNIPEYK